MDRIKAPALKKFMSIGTSPWNLIRFGLKRNVQSEPQVGNIFTSWIFKFILTFQLTLQHQQPFDNMDIEDNFFNLLVMFAVDFEGFFNG